MDKIQEEIEEKALLPEQVLNDIRITEPLFGMIRVQGKVTDLRPYPKDSPEWIYGTLTDAGASIDFKCSLSTAPRNKDANVIIQGTLGTRVDKFHSGLQVIITGNVVGNWSPYKKSDYHLVERRHGRINLTSLIKQCGLTSLQIITTQRGFNDLSSAFKKKSLDPAGNLKQVDCSFGSITALLDCARKAVEDDKTHAIAFVRGGSGDASLEIWNDPKFISDLLALDIPVYTAIGHSDPFYLVEKYSDEAFNSPTDFGDRLSEIIQNIEAEKQCVEISKRQSYENIQLKTSLEDQEIKHASSFQALETGVKEQFKRKNRILTILFSLVTLLLIITVYLLFPEHFTKL